MQTPPLPPAPPIELGPLFPLLDRAIQSLGRLDGLTTRLPDAALFVYLYMRKVALLSSWIEGTQSSLSLRLIKEIHAILLRGGRGARGGGCSFSGGIWRC